MATAANETMAEGLKKILSATAELMVLPDADVEFLMKLQATITMYIRQSSAATAGQMTGTGPGSSINDVAPGGPVPPMGGGMGGVPGMGGAAGPMAPGGMAGGGMGGLAAAPNPDELRRLLSAGVG